MSDSQQARHSQLTAQAARLKDDSALSYAADAIAGIERQHTALRRAADALQSNGYAASDAVNGLLEPLGASAQNAAAIAKARLEAYQAALAAQAEGLVADAASAAPTSEPAVVALENTAAALDAQIKQAQRDLDGITAPLNAAFSALDRHLSLAALGAEAWAEFSGQPVAGESVSTGAEAEWVGGTGRDEAPDGILYLTSSRLIFEQKEKVGKRLGLFGGKNVQEVEWALDLPQIGAVRAKNAGMLGGRDMLYVEYGGQEYTLEVKGRASNDDWVIYIERAKSGQFPIAVDVPAAPDAAQHAATLARIAQEHAAYQAAVEALAAREKAKLAMGSMAAAAGVFGKKEAAPDAPDEPESKLSGLAAAMRKASTPDEPDAAAAKGGEKGNQSSGGSPMGGKPMGGAPKKDD